MLPNIVGSSYVALLVVSNFPMKNSGFLTSFSCLIQLLRDQRKEVY